MVTPDATSEGSPHMMIIIFLVLYIFMCKVILAEIKCIFLPSYHSSLFGFLVSKVSNSCSCWFTVAKRNIACKRNLCTVENEDLVGLILEALKEWNSIRDTQSLGHGYIHPSLAFINTCSPEGQSKQQRGYSRYWLVLCTLRRRALNTIHHEHKIFKLALFS